MLELTAGTYYTEDNSDIRITWKMDDGSPVFLHIGDDTIIGAMEPTDLIALAAGIEKALDLYAKQRHQQIIQNKEIRRL